MSQSMRTSKDDFCSEMEKHTYLTSHWETFLPRASFDDSVLNVTDSRTSETSKEHKMIQLIKDGLLPAWNECIRTKYLEKCLAPTDAQCGLLC